VNGLEPSVSGTGLAESPRLYQLRLAGCAVATPCAQSWNGRIVVVAVSLAYFVSTRSGCRFTRMQQVAVPKGPTHITHGA